MKKLIIFFLLFPTSVFCQIYHGTSIAYFVQEDNIWIAADSKITHEDGSYNLECKIQTYKSFVFAISGLYRYGQIFQTDSIIKKCIDKHVDFDSVAYYVRRMLMINLSPIMNDVMNLYPIKLTDTVPILSALMCCIKNNHLRFINYSIYFRSHRLLDSILVTNKDVREGYYNQFGSRPHILPILSQNQLVPIDSNPLFTITTPGDLVYYLVYLRTKVDPSVGLPISVCRFNNHGIKWLFNELNCR